MLSRLLGFHAGVANWSEANEIWDPQGYPWHTSPLKRPPMVVDPHTFTLHWWRDNQPRQGEIQAIFGAYQWLSGRACFLNKSPLNTFRVPHLLTMFPKARFIHLIRDGRAVVYSYAQRDHQKMQMQPELYKALNFKPSFEEFVLQLGTFWKANIEEVAQQDRVLSLSQKGILLELTYENLCDDMSSVLNRICHYIGLDPCHFAPGVKQEQVELRNYKWQTGLDTRLIKPLIMAMEPTLTQKGYRDCCLDQRFALDRTTGFANG